MSTNTTTLGRQLLQRSMLALAISALGIWEFSGLAKMPNLHAAGPVTAPPVDQQAIHQANSLSHAFRSASERVLPAVVMIQHVSGPEAVASDESGKQPALPEGIPEEFRDNPMLRRFFGDSQGHRAEAPRQASMGSGVIIDASGIILTNNHVVAGGGKVTVRLHDGREFVATDVKTDPETDIAVIRIHAEGDLPFAAIGNSDHLEIGDWVIAVGSPFGLKESVTAGIISAKARGLGIAQREDFLQTDAAINPGNSGGPLVNLNGEIIGINTAISSTSGGYQGIGFAVPINLAKWVSNQLVTNGSVHRAFLGVQVQEVNGPLSKKLGLATIQGVLVTDVRPDSSGAKAGLNSGDVILEFDGQAVNTPRDLQRTVERADMAKQHTIIVMRDGQRATLTSDVAELPSDKPQASEPVATKQVEPSAFPALGLKLAPLTHEMANQLNLKSTEGVVITEVTRNSPADNVGLEAGMVIAKVGTTPVKTIAEFEVASKKITLKDGLLLLVQTGAGSRYVVLNAE